MKGYSRLRRPSSELPVVERQRVQRLKLTSEQLQRSACRAAG